MIVFIGVHPVGLFRRALVLDRIRFPGKHRRRVRVVERFVAQFCWFEANVRPEAVFETDERITEFGHHWFDVAHVHDLSSLFQFRFADTVQYFLRPPRSSIGGQVGGIRLTLFVHRRAPFDLFETNKKRNFELYERPRFRHG